MGKTLGNIAFCYYLKAFKYLDITHLDWQATRHYIQEYLSFLSQAEHPDLITNFIFKFPYFMQRQSFSYTFALANRQLRLVIQLAVLVWQRVFETQLPKLDRDRFLQHRR